MYIPDHVPELIAAAISKNRIRDAQDLIEQALSSMPAHWTPREEDDKAIRGAFWDQDEFLAYVRSHRSESEKLIVWTSVSYSKLWWQLADLNISEERFDNAALCIDRGLQLDPDHPLLWIERGYILNRVGRHQEALEAYQKATSVCQWAPSAVIARATRGQGSALIDLEQFSEARTAYLASLELDPDSETAHKELEYIDQELTDKKKRAETPPWFLHAIRFPPTDQLTLQLLPLVKGMESIPGPKTVGAENYATISKAFLAAGWAGFEEAFDKVIPRGRADYADIKRDLLREPIFNSKVHERMSKRFLGHKTVVNTVQDIEGEDSSSVLQ
jgi:tetratricopeptide (TPR) repeat protein